MNIGVIGDYVEMLELRIGFNLHYNFSDWLNKNEQFIDITGELTYRKVVMCLSNV